jgi:hypothetical protein
VKARDMLGALATLAPVSGAEPDIRDIRGPIHIPPVWLGLLAAVAAAALLLAVGAAAYWLVRRLRRGRVKSAAELALDRLERARALAQEGHAAELAAEASDAVREYIEACFAVRAAHRSTEEFLHDLLEGGVSAIAAHRQALGDFLVACDLAKFARFDIPIHRMGAMIDAAQIFVRTTSGPPADDPRPHAADVNAVEEIRT